MYLPAWQVINDPFVMLVILLSTPASCWWLSRRRFTLRSNRGLAVMAVGLFALFATFVFPWGMFTVHLRWFPLLAWLAASAAALHRPLIPAGLEEHHTRRRRWALTVCAGILLLIDAGLLKGLAPPRAAVELAFPFSDGDYYVVQGGGSSWLNHHYPHDAKYRYALDIVRLNSIGRRANGLLPEAMEAYWIYGEAVLSPCGGKIVGVKDGWVDSPIFSRDADEPGGNQIVIDCGGAYVWLEHLRKNSIQVAVGQAVQPGEVLAQVGSSGASSEPHLHIHARTVVDGEPGESIGIFFNGRYLARNMVFRASDD